MSFDFKKFLYALHFGNEGVYLAHACTIIILLRKRGCRSSTATGKRLSATKKAALARIRDKYLSLIRIGTSSHISQSFIFLTGLTLFPTQKQKEHFSGHIVASRLLPD
jgi:hypothetical protein